MSSYGYQTRTGFWMKVTASTLPLIKGIPKKCAECGSENNLTIDHKLPRATNPKARGYLANYQLLCVRCNMKKSGANPPYSDGRNLSLLPNE